MREFRQLSIDSVHESERNPRRTMQEDDLEELTASVRVHGVLQPILVRPDGAGFAIIAGGRRHRAAKRAGHETMSRVLNVDEAMADEAAIVENLQRKNLSPIDEGESYQRLLAAGRTIDELSARFGKPKAYIYRFVSLTRLIPRAQELVAEDILPLNYALELAKVPVERQADGLERCFRPLFKDEPRRDQLEPLAELTTWIEKTVRLNPKSDATAILLPALAEQVSLAEEERHASVLALSTLTFHTDRSDPKPILAKSWKPAEGKDKCQYARPGVIVLGDGQNTFLHACIEKKKCRKHWGRPTPTKDQAAHEEADEKAAAARKRQEARWAKEAADTERWRKVLRPCALRLVAERASKQTWSPKLVALLLEDLGVDTLFTEIVGKPSQLPARRYPQAAAVAIAARHSWNRDAFMRTAKRLGVGITAKAIENAAPAGEPSPTEARVVSDRESTEDAHA